jgi:hypothetical protein
MKARKVMKHNALVDEVSFWINKINSMYALFILMEFAGD